MDGRPPRDPRAAALDRRRRRGEVTDPGIVLEAGATYLAAQPRSVVETRAHLTAAGYDPTLVEIAIERLLELRILDDRAFAGAWIESRDRTRPRSASALRRELEAKGIDEALVGELLAERERAAGSAAGYRPRPPVGPRRAREDHPGGAHAAGDADEAAARRLLERKGAALAREADPARRRAKAWSLLARNGFGADLCLRLLGEDDMAADALRSAEGPIPARRGSAPGGIGRTPRPVDPDRPDAPDRSSDQDPPDDPDRPAEVRRRGGSLKRTPLRPGGSLTRRTPLGRGSGLSRRPPTR